MMPSYLGQPTRKRPKTFGEISDCAGEDSLKKVYENSYRRSLKRSRANSVMASVKQRLPSSFQEGYR
jgi:hypothetical protein